MAGSHGQLASLFDPQSAAYAQYRPRYPPELYARVLDFAGLCGPQADRQLAVDLGCGSGQATADLAALFQRVVGIDASAEQVARAPRGLPNAEFRCLPVEATRLPDRCADLVTAATSLHWFDLPAAYREIRRVLKPGGALAAWTYTPWAGLAAPDERYQVDTERAQRVHDALVDAFWHHIHPRLQRLIRDRTYDGYLPAQGEFEVVQLDTLDMFRELSVAEVVGWVRSWSAFEPYCQQHGQAAAEQLLEQYQRDMMSCLGGVPDEHTPIRTRWPILLLLARGPAAVGAGGGGGAAAQQ